MLRFVIVVFVTWFAIALWPEHDAPRPHASKEEKLWTSTTCKDSRWYLEDSDDLTVTVACYEVGGDN